MNRKVNRENVLLNLIITGVGGQGNVLLAQLVGRALVKAGYYVTIGETYGPAQRGGAVMSHIRISEDTELSPLIPDGGADVILGLEPIETLRVLGQYGNPQVATLTNTRPVYPIAVSAGEAEYPSLERIKELVHDLSRDAWFIDATDMALNLGAPILTNIIMAGSLLGTRLMPLEEDRFECLLRESFPSNKQDMNLQAFRKGFELTAKRKQT